MSDAPTTAPARKKNPARLVVVIVLAVVLVGFVAFAASQVTASRQADVVGGVQKFAIDTASGKFVPNVINAKAGVPIEITFGAGGNACAAAATFEFANITQDTVAGGVVTLPALAAGTYKWIAACGDTGGTITVQ
jgi:hypothetical protein